MKTVTELETEKPQNTVRSVERALTVLFEISRSEKPLGVSEISLKAGLDKATALPTAHDARSVRLVQRDRGDAQVHGWIWRVAPRELLRERPGVDRGAASGRLRDLTRESVTLVVVRGLERVVLMAVEASHELRVVPALNSVVPIYSGASGKVFMASCLRPSATALSN